MKNSYKEAEPDIEETMSTMMANEADEEKAKERRVERGGTRVDRLFSLESKL